MKTTYRSLLNACENTLKEAGVPDASWDAWMLLASCFGLERSRYFLDRDKEQEMDRNLLAEFEKMTGKRAQRIPLQHLLGSTEFMGLPFIVNRFVLIPRADTETLVEVVLNDRKRISGGRLLDMCTGSGCIAVSLTVLGSFDRTDAADVSEDALAVAKKNAALNGTEICFYQSDLFENIEGCYDVIVSNPPYIEERVILTLEPEVRDFEPRIALNGGKDGLDFYRRLASDAGAHLRPGGAVYLEIGYDQGKAVSQLLSEHGFEEIHVIKDLAGCDRVVAALWRREK